MTQQTVVRSAPVVTAAALVAESRRLGFVPGFPPALCRPARLADLTAYRRAKCPACASRMAARPFHRPGVDGYTKDAFALVQTSWARPFHRPGVDGYRLILCCSCPRRRRNGLKPHRRPQPERRIPMSVMLTLRSSKKKWKRARRAGASLPDPAIVC